MSDIDQTLDDIIKKNKASGQAGGGRRRRGGNRASGPVRNAPNRLGIRSTPYSIGKPRRRNQDNGGGGGGGGAWQHDMFSDSSAPVRKPLGIETGTKLHISNLDYGVSTEDIKELFSAHGDLKKCTVNFDKSGRSKSTAEVVFARKVDAQKAMKHYNFVQLDGKPMKIEIMGTNIVTGYGNAKANSNNMSNLNNSNGANARPAGFRGRPRFGKRNNRGKPGGGNKTQGKGGGGGGGGTKSAQELDADLDSYHAEAMQIS